MKKGPASTRKTESTRGGFTLIELLVVISIMAGLLAFALPNYLGARERARDTKLKSEMSQVKNALRMYYNDYQKYPEAGNAAGGQYPFKGCGPLGATLCNTTTYACTNFWFAAGGADGCGTVYMKKPPSPASGVSLNYYQMNGGDGFILCASKLENSSDPEAAASRVQCLGYGGATGYCVCSD